jgi:transposase-like protein
MTSYINWWRRYRTQYGKDPPSDNTIRRWLKQFQETGSVLHWKGAVIETVTPQMENTCREIEYRLDILRATKGAHVQVV